MPTSVIASIPTEALWSERSAMSVACVALIDSVPYTVNDASCTCEWSMLTSPPSAIAIVEAPPAIGADDSVMYPRLRWPYCATLKADPVPLNTHVGSDSSPVIDTRIADPAAHSGIF